MNKPPKSEKDEATEAEAEMMCFEDGGRIHSQGVQKAFRKWERPGNRFSSRASKRKTKFVSTLTLAL
jgi:hypothetical protein